MSISNRREIIGVLPWLSAILATLIGYWLLLGLWSAWETLFLLPTSPGAWFPDIYAVLAASDVNAAGYNPYGSNPLGVRHYYPRSWFMLADLGLTRANAPWLGLLLGGIFLGVSLVWLRPSRYRDAAYVVACLLAPPITLGFQRANVDNILYMLLAGVAIMLTSNRTLVRIGVGVTLIMLATLLKFYPMFGAAAVWWHETKKRRRYVVLLFGVLAGVFGMSLLEDYRQISKMVNLTTIGLGHLYSFGMNFEPVLRGVAWTGVIMCGVAAWGGWRHVAPRLAWRDDEPQPVAFMLGACVLLGCFVVGCSFAYRLVFVLLMIPWWWRLRDSGDRVLRIVAVASLVCTLALFWRDAVVAGGLRGMHREGWVETHNFIVGWHRQALAMVQWGWCALVVCLAMAMARQIPVANKSGLGRT
jgi:hypothetical protein